MSDKLLSFEDMVDYYKEQGFLSKFQPFELSDFHEQDEGEIMSIVLKFVNETMFSAYKILVPTDLKVIFSNIFGIFNYEFTYYYIVHKYYQQIFDLKLQKILESEDYESLVKTIDELSVFIGYDVDNSELITAKNNNEYHKFIALQDQYINELMEYYELNSDTINTIDSIEEFVCVPDNAYYSGSFLMNAKECMNELFSTFHIENPMTKFNLMFKLHTELEPPVQFDVIKFEIMKSLSVYLDKINENEPSPIVLTDSFWNDYTNTIISFIIQFVKECTIESLLGFKNTKLRIKLSNIQDIFKNMCPRSKILTISQINFIQYISRSNAQLKQLLFKKYDYKH